MPFDNDILKALDQAYISKSQNEEDNDGVTAVRLGWYSRNDRNRTYHVCVHCGQYGRIQSPNLEISTADKLEDRGFTLCYFCEICLRPGHECQGMFLTVLEV